MKSQWCYFVFFLCLQLHIYCCFWHRAKARKIEACVILLQWIKTRERGMERCQHCFCYFRRDADSVFGMDAPESPQGENFQPLKLFVDRLRLW